MNEFGKAGIGFRIFGVYIIWVVRRRYETNNMYEEMSWKETLYSP